MSATDARKHGTKAAYAGGCHCELCRKAQAESTAAVRLKQRIARIELEQRLAKRLRAALYHAEPWLQPPSGFSPITWRNEANRVIKRLEQGHVSVKRAAR